MKTLFFLTVPLFAKGGETITCPVYQNLPCRMKGTTGRDGINTIWGHGFSWKIRFKYPTLSRYRR